MESSSSARSSILPHRSRSSSSTGGASFVPALCGALLAGALLVAAPATRAVTGAVGSGESLLAAQVVSGVTAADATQEVDLGPVDGRDLPPTEIDRIQVGAPAPDFTLAAYGGGTVTLSDFRGEKNVVMVFYRGFWCPYCIRQLAELRDLLDEAMKQDTEILAISVDAEEETGRTVTRIRSDGAGQPDFTFLMDPNSAVIGRYGILNPSGSRRGIPHPAAFVVDKEGIVRWRDVQPDYTIRPTNEQIREALREVWGG